MKWKFSSLAASIALKGPGKWIFVAASAVFLLVDARSDVFIGIPHEHSFSLLLLVRFGLGKFAVADRIDGKWQERSKMFSAP